MVSKRMQAARAVVDCEKVYIPLEGLEALLESAKKGSTKYRQSIELVIRLGINPKKENVRGATNLPFGTGKKIKIAVIATGEAAKLAKDAGADAVGCEDLLKEMEKGNLDYDVLISTPDQMAKVGRLGKVLGPKGLMPNPKDGTVSANPAEAVKQALAGKVMYRNEKAGLIHVLVGHTDLAANQLLENIQAVVANLVKLKPTTAKGRYLKKGHVSTSMGPSVEIDLQELSS